MSEVGANASTHSVSEAALGSDIVKQARGESSTKGFVENADGVIVRIVASGPQRNHPDVALVYILFRDEVVAGFSRIVCNVVLGKIRTFGPGIERGAQPGFHGGGIEISADAENDVIGVHVLAVPVHQVLASDRGNGRIFRNAGIGIVHAVSQFYGFAMRDSADFI